MINLVKYINEFLPLIGSNHIEIYNEFSLQHELGIHLRRSIKNDNEQYLVQFERNVSFFGLHQKSDFEKKEIDIVVYTEDKAEKYAIELKYPKNGQYPEQMFKICQDIVFLEQLIIKGGFNKCYSLIIADDGFYEKGSQAGIYQYFRAGKKLSGNITKPTGKQDHSVTLNGSYRIKWQKLYSSMKYCLLEITHPF